MRAQGRRVIHEEEEESAFVSMTDMTVGFLFIMMILLAFFVSQIREPDAVSQKVHTAVVNERDYWRDISQSQSLQIAKLETEISEISAQLIKRKEEIAKLNEEIRRLKSFEIRVAALEEQISAMWAQIKEQTQVINELRADLSRLKKIDPLEEYLARVSSVRRDVLTKLRDAIKADFPDLQVELSEESDALRFQGEGLFASGSSNLFTQKRTIVGKLGQRLNEVLPCFAVGERSQFSQDCNPGYVMIEAVQIEGHTDNEGSDTFNRNLSTARANNTFFAMATAAPLIMDHRNLKLQPVLSVAAYGPDRPIATNDTNAGRATNRRIDLRFIMVTPQDTSGIAAIKKALETISGPIE